MALLLAWLAAPTGAAHAEELEAPPATTADPAVEDFGFEEGEDDWLFEEEAGDHDPIESGNRAIFGINERLYRYLLDPIADGYEWAVPDVVRRAVRRFFGNLEEPAILVNDVFQGRARRAGTTGSRFLINSTLGLGGLFDPATAWGLDGHDADFGETLGVYGVGSGPYLVLPVMGPSNTRDAVGGLVDGLLRPDTWLLGAGPLAMVFTGDGLSTYDVERRQLEELRRSSLDFYAALRSAYRMDREARIRRAREARCEEDDELAAIPPPAESLR